MNQGEKKLVYKSLDSTVYYPLFVGNTRGFFTIFCTDYSELNAQEQFIDDFLHLQFQNFTNYCSYLSRISQDITVYLKGLKYKKWLGSKASIPTDIGTPYACIFLVILLRLLFLYYVLEYRGITLLPKRITSFKEQLECGGQKVAIELLITAALI